MESWKMRSVPKASYRSVCSQRTVTGRHTWKGSSTDANKWYIHMKTVLRTANSEAVVHCGEQTESGS
jgi:hypothetical protein